jgi:hypothetical protein
MTLETAKALISTTANCYQTALDTQNKVTALEKALQKYEPNLYQSYLGELADSETPASFIILRRSWSPASKTCRRWGHSIARQSVDRAYVSG